MYRNDYVTSFTQSQFVWDSWCNCWRNTWTTMYQGVVSYAYTWGQPGYDGQNGFSATDAIRNPQNVVLTVLNGGSVRGL
jgi:hypothetical protein